MRTAAVFTLALALVGGGCHRANTAFRDDLGVGDAPDLAGDDAPDLAGSNVPDLAESGPPDMTPPTPLPSDFRIYGGTTTDGWAVLGDAAGSAWAVKISDGTERHIADHQQLMWTTLDASFVIHDGQNGIGKLELWHKDGPAVHLADQAVDSVPGAPPLSAGPTSPATTSPTASAS